ncbi:hypothetical protein SNEBB_001369 [Seison nebaliae]|nr:hypothetical protein SNEBB_001369 [Seison nebaliae]
MRFLRLLRNLNKYVPCSNRQFCVSSIHLNDDLNKKNKLEVIGKELPIIWRNYKDLIRFDRPTGTYLLWLPSSFAIGLCSNVQELPDLYMMSIFGIGSFLMRSGGCIINDIHDRKIDGKVERTSNRPIASNRISVRLASIYLLSNIILSGSLILFDFNLLSIQLCVAILPFVFTYPLAKRCTFLPQLYLGLTYNWSSVVAYGTCMNHLVPSVILPLYISCIFWTLFYDTGYAFQDIKDDEKIGVKSLARLLKRFQKEKVILSIFLLSSISSLAVIPMMNPDIFQSNKIFYMGLISSTIYGMNLLRNLNLYDDRKSGGVFFERNVRFGLLILSSIILAKYLDF